MTGAPPWALACPEPGCGSTANSLVAADRIEAMRSHLANSHCLRGGKLKAALQALEAIERGRAPGEGGARWGWEYHYCPTVVKTVVRDDVVRAGTVHTQREHSNYAAPICPEPYAIAARPTDVPLESDPVNHPAHYTSHPSGVECITVTEHMGFNVGNAIKYLWRADEKGNALEDLRKAAWYVQREIARRERGQA